MKPVRMYQQKQRYTCVMTMSDTQKYTGGGYPTHSRISDSIYTYYTIPYGGQPARLPAIPFSGQYQQILSFLFAYVPPHLGRHRAGRRPSVWKNTAQYAVSLLRPADSHRSTAVLPAAAMPITMAPVRRCTGRIRAAQ